MLTKVCVKCGEHDSDGDGLTCDACLLKRAERKASPAIKALIYNYKRKIKN